MASESAGWTTTCGAAVTWPLSLVVSAAGLSRSQLASLTTQLAALGIAAGDELRIEVTRRVTAPPARGLRSVRRRLDRLATVGIPWAFDAVLSRLDLTEIVIRRVDLDRVVASVDLDAAVSRVDLDRVVAGVDLDAAVSRVDLDAAISRVDLLGLAQFIIDGVNLPAIVRESSASFTSEAVHGLRVHGVEADRAVSRVVDHLIPRRRNADGTRRSSQSSSEPLS